MKNYKFGTILATVLASTAMVAALGCDPAKDEAAGTATTTGSTTEAATTTGSATATDTSATGGNGTTEAGTPDSVVSSDPSAASTASAEQKSPSAQGAGGLSKTASPGVKAPKAGDPVAIITTNHGRIVVRFFQDKAPGHVKNFVTLANKKFYDGTKFHRVIPNFMIQGGDPNTKPGGEKNGPPGTGGPGYSIAAEFNDIKHTAGILSMARSQDPNSAGSQFFIMHSEYPSLDNQYSVFGQVLEGMDVVEKIVNLPKDDNDMPTQPAVMQTVRIVKWPVKLK
jgi:cyclophilin family peptidyl-prolyl cis-trans isomerase